MAAPGLKSPWDDEALKPRTGPPIQNMGGLGRNMAPIAQRPVSAPGVKLGPPGPAPTSPSPSPSGGMLGGIAGKFAPLIGGNAPAPGTMPGPPQPAAPAPSAAPGPAAPSPSSGITSQGYYLRGGGAGPGGGSLEDTLRSYIGNAMGGVTSRAFVDRARGALGAATEGQRQQRVNQIDQDAVRRGIFSSGIPAELAASAGNSASNTFASKLSDILQGAEQQDIAGRESAAGVAGNLLGANRSYDQWLMSAKQDEADRAARGSGKEDTSFVYVDPDTGESYQMDESWF